MADILEFDFAYMINAELRNVLPLKFQILVRSEYYDETSMDISVEFATDVLNVHHAGNQ